MTVTLTQPLSAGTASEPDLSHCRALLEKMAGNWHRRAQVARAREKVTAERSPEYAFDPKRPDFRTDLLPFASHPDFVEAPAAWQERVLSCGWLAYNAKTIDIESQAIAPACNAVIYRELPGVEDGASQLIASDTLVDEAYHVQLVVSACRITRERRDLEALRLPSFNLVKQMRREQARCSEPWQRLLVQFATATVSEVFISDYLELMATDETVQPFNRLTVLTHFRDEKAHHSIFKQLAQCVYASLTSEQKVFFAEVLPKPVRWFADAELEVWRAMLDQIGFPNADRMVADVESVRAVNLMRVDYSGIVSLAEELGILDCAEGRTSFEQAGLLN